MAVVEVVSAAYTANDLVRVLNDVLAAQKDPVKHLMPALLDLGAKCLAVVALLVTTNLLLLNIARDAYERDPDLTHRPTLKEPDRWVQEPRLMSNHAARCRRDLDALTSLIRDVARVVALIGVFVVGACGSIAAVHGICSHFNLGSVTAVTGPMVSFLAGKVEIAGDLFLVSLTFLVMVIVVWFIPDMTLNLLFARQNHRENKPPIKPPAGASSP